MSPTDGTLTPLCIDANGRPSVNIAADIYSYTTGAPIQVAGNVALPVPGAGADTYLITSLSYDEGGGGAGTVITATDAAGTIIGKSGTTVAATSISLIDAPVALSGSTQISARNGNAADTLNATYMKIK